METKELNKSFVGKGQVKGFVFNQIKSSKKGYIYEVNDNGSIHYEVFLRKINTMFNTVSYPSDKSFGKWAWTCRTIERAENKFNEINN